MSYIPLDLPELKNRSIGLNDIPIPSRFMLGGIEIEVIYDSVLLHKEDALGQADYDNSRIYLQDNVQGVFRSKQEIELAFFHELTHMVLHTVGERELRDNEKFVDAVSRIFHQAFKTANYA